MGNHLIIDAGNTSIKLGVFNPSSMIHHRQWYGSPSYLTLQKIISKYGIESGLISNVGKAFKVWNQVMDKHSNILMMDERFKFPISFCYSDIAQLGFDRRANMMAVYKQFFKKNILIINMGTAITYDFMSHQGSFVEGSISPGLYLRGEILKKKTSRLPEISFLADYPLGGSNTKACIGSGVFYGLLFEIQGFIDYYCNKFKPVFCVFSGADWKQYKPLLRASKFWENFYFEPYLTLQGINEIKAYNHKLFSL